jgi:hypothetical protein
VLAITKRLLVGRPLRSTRLGETLLPKRLALPVFCSDPLSSNAYATEILRALSLGGLALLFLTPWVALAVVVLLAVVVVSYRQTCHAYPNGGGAYAVSRENLGRNASLVAASALLVDYVLTVAVSVAAGVDAITSAFLSLRPHAVATLAAFRCGARSDESARCQGVRDHLRHPDLRLHHSSLRHDRLGFLAAADRRYTRCRICLIRYPPQAILLPVWRWSRSRCERSPRAVPP